MIRFLSDGASVEATTKNKTCIDCGQAKPQSDFYNRDPACKSCRCARVRLYRLTNPKVQEYDCERAKTPKRREHRRANSLRWRAEHPEAYRAHNAANNAIRDGKLERQPCQMCGSQENVHKHHRNYSRPLDVIFLCARCHHRLHAIFPEMQEYG
jgi:hypothetical protein